MCTYRTASRSTDSEGQRRYSSVKAVRPSRRARWAPMQWWMPWPKLMPSGAWRPMSNRSGSSYARSSRLAAPVTMQHRAAGGDRDAVQRPVLDGVPALVLRRRPQRSTSSTADPARRRVGLEPWHWSGCPANVMTPLPTSLVTVSAPAPPAARRTRDLGVVEALDVPSSAPPRPRSGGRSCRRPGACRRSATSLRVLVDARRDAARCPPSVRERVAHLALEHGVDPVADLLAVGLGHAERSSR